VAAPLTDASLLLMTVRMKHIPYRKASQSAFPNAPYMGPTSLHQPKSKRHFEVKSPKKNKTKFEATKRRQTPSPKERGFAIVRGVFNRIEPEPVEDIFARRMEGEWGSDSDYVLIETLSTEPRSIILSLRKAKQLAEDLADAIERSPSLKNRSTEDA
jgi:hypothetical protein